MQDTIVISGLKPMIAPEAVASWPPAPGWYILIALCLVVLVILVFRSIRRWKSNLYRREALQQLEMVRSSTGEKIGPQDVGELNRILKTTAIFRFSREKLASLSGVAWLDFLEESCPSLAFTPSPGKHLAGTAYMKAEQLDLSEEQWARLTELVEKWIRKHH